MITAPRISIIVAMARTTRTIGKDGGGIPWHIKEDFAHFKQTTMGHPIIMGRKTWEEFRGKPLPGRTHIVITSQKGYAVPTGHIVCDSITTAIKKASEIETQQAESNSTEPEIFIIGGAQIYAQALPYTDRLYVTLVDVDIEGPAKFPEYIPAGFTQMRSSKKSSDGTYTYEFLVLEKR